MAFEADRVVVELIAKVDQFDKPVKASTQSFDQSMDKIAASATKAEQAVTRSSGARVQAIQRESAQISQFARLLGTQLNDVGALLTSAKSPFVVPVREAPRVSGALRLVQVGAASLAGVIGGVLVTATFAAVEALVDLIEKGGGTERKINDLVQKLKEHAEQTRLSDEADQRWGRTLEGLRDRVHQLNEELGKRLQVQSQVDDLNLRQAQSDRDRLIQELATEKESLARLQQQLRNAPKGGVGIGQGAGTAGVETAQLADKVAKSQQRILDLQKSLDEAASAATRGMIIQGEAQGKALADLTEKARLWGEMQIGILRGLQQENPTLTIYSKNLNAATESLKDAMAAAASAGVDFNDTIRQSDALTHQLNLGQIAAPKYAAEITKLAAALKKAAEEAKNLKKQDPVEVFKRNVIGAEGLGNNPMSSASGFGQFIKGTWLKEFDKVFPQFAKLSDASKLALRDNKQVAEAIIDSYARENKKFLEGFGATVTAASLYLAHVLGPAGAKKVLQAAPGTPVQQVVSPEALKANPFMAKAGTAGGLQREIARRIGASSSDISQGVAAIDRALDQELQRQQQYMDRKSTLEGQVLDARQALITSAEEISKLERLAIDVSHDKYEQEVASLESTGKLHKEEAEELRKLNDTRRDLRKEAVQRRDNERNLRIQEEAFQRAAQFQQGSADVEADLLQSQLSLAKTAKERRDIERRLIDLQFYEEKLKNQYVLDWAERVKANKDATEKEKADAEIAAQIAQLHLNTAEQRQSNAQTGNDRNNASPLQDYFNSIPQTADEINDAFERVAAGGLATFTDALTDAIVNFHSLGDVGRAVLSSITASLVRMAIQQIILHTIGKALGMTATAATAAQAAAVAAAWAPAAAAASLATLGANAGPAAAAIASTNALSYAFALGGPKAQGGRIIGSGSDTSDNILTPSSRDEFMIRARSARRIGYSTLDYINRYGELPPGMAGGGRIRGSSDSRIIRPMNVPAARPGGGHGTFGKADLSELRGIVGDAISAMPPVQLFPTMDPEAAIQAMLNSAGGRRRFFEFVNNNSGQFKASLNQPS